MRLQENIKNRKMMHHDDTAGHGHNHEHDGCCCGHEHDHEHHHDHDDCCGHDHEHDHHHDHDGCCCGHEYGHSHGHGCDCCEDGVEIEKNKTIAGVAVFLVAFVVFHIPGLFKSFSDTTMENIELVAFLLIYLVTAKDIVLNAIKNLFKGKALDEQFLMSVASLGAFIVGEYPEACAVMLFYMVGELFQDYAVDKSRDSITELMDIRPDYANILKKDGTIEKVDPNKVKVGDTIIVKPGEKVPLDGVIIEGQGTLDTSSLTGESLPREVGTKEAVISGSISVSGVLTIKVTKAFGESTVSKILELVENASSKKAKTERFITRFAKVYTPIVVGLAIALAIAPPLIMATTGSSITDFYGVWSPWIYRALTFLVVSCPCALVISVPLSFFAGIGAASTKGVLVKGSNYLELISKCDTVVFDKTGTLTKAKPTVSRVYSFNGMPEDELLRIAACLEEHFPHSMAKAVVNEAGRRNLMHEEMHSKVEYIVAHGISTFINTSKVIIGSHHFVFEDESCVIPAGKQELFDSLPDDCSHLYMAINGQLAAVICIIDPLREEAPEVIEGLKKAGISKVVMMTGDSERTAASIARKVGVTEYYSEVLPEDKAKFVEKERAAGRKVIMIGDGINDSPALSAADVGIAISDGAEIAREIADITVGADDLNQILMLKKLSDSLIKKINRNYRVIVGFNSALIALGVTGVIQPTTSALLHNTSTLVISLESMKNLPV